MIPGLATLLRPLLQAEATDKHIQDFDGFVRVEVGLRLLEVLGLDREPPLTVWALLQGHGLPAIAALHLSELQRRCLANFRAAVHQSSATDWLNDLDQYGQIPVELRLYDVRYDDDGASSCFQRTGHQSFRAERYDRVLGQVLPHRSTTKNLASGGVPYLYPLAERQQGRVVFPEALVQVAAARSLPARPPRKTHREAYRYTYKQLLGIANQLDELEAKRNWRAPGNWTYRLEQMLRFRPVYPDGSLGNANSADICIDGLTHIPGMVGSGKSTMAMLIAVDFYLSHRGRIVLVAPDVPDVLRQVEYLNTVLVESSGDDAAAVPLIGFTERDTHLRKLFGANQFDVWQSDWVLRYLDTTCLAIDALSGVDETQGLHARKAGRYEPCEDLVEEAEHEAGSNHAGTKRRSVEGLKQYLCPLFSVCPMQAVYQDLFRAPIWITTVGGLAQGRIPLRVDPHNSNWWALVYEHADLLIFDEVDASQSWFDNLFAPELNLDDTSTGGLLQSVLRKLGDHPSGSWRRSSDADRWRQSFDQTTPLARNMLGMIESDETLRRWLTALPYSPVRIIEDLAERLSWRYLWYGDKEAPPQEIQQQYDSIRNALIAIARSEPLEGQSEQGELYQRLLALANAVALQGRSQISRATRQTTLEIIRSAHNRLSHLQNLINERIRDRAYRSYLYSQGMDFRRARTDTFEPLTDERMANRLEFALVVIRLDNALRGVFYGWASVEDLLGDELLPSFIPRSMIGLVPIPPTGYWRGFRTMPAHETAKADTLSLSTFEYAGVGRQILARFSQLLVDMDGLPGPHVLAMSGTSYLPGSSRFHFAANAVGVLEPPEDVQEAIRRSEIAFIPQLNRQGELIRISGAGNQMVSNLRDLLDRLSTVPAPVDSMLSAELDHLGRLGVVDPEHWADRARIILMVNSYDQARLVANYLRAKLPPHIAEQVHNLARSGEELDLWATNQQIYRSEVELRAVEARILVAPIGALGRGYNLVSPRTRKAAFGAIYFLIRPMTPPYDATQMVAGINSYLDRLLHDSEAEIWEKASIYEQMRALRDVSRRQWQLLETHQQYRSMLPEQKLQLGADTASVIIQSCGRLVRGGVPFHAFFVDAAWVQPDEDDAGVYLAYPSRSLLAAAVQVLNRLADTPIGQPLYGSFAQALSQTRGVTFRQSTP